VSTICTEGNKPVFVPAVAAPAKKPSAKERRTAQVAAFMTKAADFAEAAKQVHDAATSAPKTEVPAQVTKAPVPEVPAAAAWVRSKHRDTGLPLYTPGDQTVTYADAKSPWVLKPQWCGAGRVRQAGRCESRSAEGPVMVEIPGSGGLGFCRDCPKGPTLVVQPPCPGGS
jgi:hypothetical protein